MKDYRIILVYASSVMGHVKHTTFEAAMENATEYHDFDSPLEALKFAVTGVNNETINTQDFILLYSTRDFKLVHF